MDCRLVWSGRDAAAELSLDTRRNIITRLAETLQEHVDDIIQANQVDLASADPKFYDRLLLTPERVASMSMNLLNLIQHPDPCGRILHTFDNNGLRIVQTTVPFGIIGMIYEARPNVTIDAFALSVYTGNACVLKGGSEAHHTNTCLIRLIHQVLTELELSVGLVTLMPSSRESVEALLNSDISDLLIPRGSKGLIEYIRDNARVPVIETGAGVVHIYFDLSGDADIGAKVITNSKLRRVTVCNALDSLLVHYDRLHDLPYLVKSLHNVKIYADIFAYEVLHDHHPNVCLCDDDMDGVEFLDYVLAIKTVFDSNAAISHINAHGSHHSDGIIAEDLSTIATFTAKVDSAVVYVNASTAFTDGTEFGLGGEIGISTQKLHARGPFSIQSLVTTKFIATGNGHIRE